MSEKFPASLDLGLIDPTADSLNRQSLEVPLEKISSHEIQALIDEMLNIAKGEQGDSARKTMVGLAAPQIGVNKRIIIVGINAAGMGEEPKLKAYVNPVITQLSDELVANREGCYSADRVCGIVNRPSSVAISAYDRNGNEVTEVHRGFPARIFQHEIDHLEGIRFPDRIKDDAKLHWVEPEEFGEYRENWATWSNLCERKKWLEIKGK